MPVSTTRQCNAMSGSGNLFAHWVRQTDGALPEWFTGVTSPGTLTDHYYMQAGGLEPHMRRDPWNPGAGVFAPIIGLNLGVGAPAGINAAQVGDHLTTAQYDATPFAARHMSRADYLNFVCPAPIIVICYGNSWFTMSSFTLITTYMSRLGLDCVFYPSGVSGQRVSGAGGMDTDTLYIPQVRDVLLAAYNQYPNARGHMAVLFEPINEPATVITTGAQMQGYYQGILDKLKLEGFRAVHMPSGPPLAAGHAFGGGVTATDYNNARNAFYTLQKTMVNTNSTSGFTVTTDRLNERILGAGVHDLVYRDTAHTEWRERYKTGRDGIQILMQHKGLFPPPPKPGSRIYSMGGF